MKRPRLYFVPGMGADHRLFAAMQEAGIAFTVLEHLPPVKRQSLADYAHRMAALIDQSQPFMLGGVSLGGMVAVEMAKICQPEMVLLISSCKSSRETPAYLKIFRYLPLQRLIPGKILKAFGPRSPFKAGPGPRALLNGMRRDAPADHIQWACDAVVRWKSKAVPERLVHVHGTWDLVLPGLFVRGRQIVRRGTHVMVMVKTQQVIDLLEAAMEKHQFALPRTKS